MKTHTSTLKDFMSAQVRATLGDAPTWHSNCLAASGRDKEGRGGVARVRDFILHRTCHDQSP
jgi:hypothetical protein